MARPKNQEIPTRSKRMYEMRKSGHSLEEIAEQMGVSRATAARGVAYHRDTLTSAFKKRFGEDK